MDTILKFIEWFVERTNILKIVLSPLLIGVVIGFIFYINKPDIIGQILGVGIALIGLIIGILFARKVKKSTTATEFNSRINASPDLDNLEGNKNSK